MVQVIWRKLKQQASLCREVVLPGVLIVGFVVLIRLMGLLQIQEWMALDASSRLCPERAIASQVVIVGIDEDNLNTGSLLFSDADLAKAISTLAASRPRVIGLDLYRDLPVEPGHDALLQVFKTVPNIIGVETALNTQDSLNMRPPPQLPPERIGFTDAVVDDDGKVRRIILSNADPSYAGQTQIDPSYADRGEPGQEIRYSFAFRLVQMYLAAQGIQFQPKTLQTLRFGATELQRFQSNSGGYIQANAKGNQRMLNFCASQQLFRNLSMRDVLTQRFSPEWIRDRIIIIGMAASSVKDIFFTSALRETISSQASGNPFPATRLIYGAEVQAYGADQLLREVLEQRSALRFWSDGWEYLWIVGWGCVGIALGLVLQSPWKSLINIAIALVGLIGICFLALLMGWWIPVVPPGLALGGAGLVTAFFDRDLRFELAQRRKTIERTYESVHNGPLQHLAVILRELNEEVTCDRLQQELQALNQELRNIFEHMREEALTRSDRFYLNDNRILDLQAPISELLYQVYDYTLELEAPGFASIQTYIPPDFDMLKTDRFSPEQKRGLCLFLQEALWNVGKHAMGATRLDVMCIMESEHYILRITDNGLGIVSTHRGQGTRQARAIARELGGQFRRYFHSPQGTSCELMFPIMRSWLKRFY
ncbi:MAG TPA: CHASE2 domain-containing protein [Coleofasciculaceae cyanobacterium]